MFIAHLPAGYILAKRLNGRARALDASPGLAMLSCLFGAIAPDLDLFYFYLVDQRQHHHHSYVSHWPILWLTLTACALLALHLGRRKAGAVMALLFSLSGLLHMLLDSVTGNIRWLAPWSDKPYSLFTVSPGLDPWWLNFLLHGSFALELAIAVWALTLFRRAQRGRCDRSGCRLECELQPDRPD